MHSKAIKRVTFCLVWAAILLSWSHSLLADQFCFDEVGISEGDIALRIEEDDDDPTPGYWKIRFFSDIKGYKFDHAVYIYGYQATPEELWDLEGYDDASMVLIDSIEEDASVELAILNRMPNTPTAVLIQFLGYTVKTSLCTQEFLLEVPKP